MSTYRDPQELETWRASFRAAQQEGPGCPEESDLVAFVAGAMEAGQRARVPEHVVDCRRCSEAVRVLFEIERQARGAPPVPAPRSHRKAVGLAAAASLVAVLSGLAAWQAIDRTGASEPAWRLRGAGDEAVVVPAPDARLPEAPREIRWTAPGDARGFRLSLRTASADLVWRSPEVTESRLVLPEEVRTRLAGGAYSWTVDVRGSLSASKLGPFWFQLGPGPPAAR